MATPRTSSYLAASGGGVFAGIAGAPAWRAGLAVGVWKELPGTAVAGYTTPGGNVVSGQVIDAYSGMFVANDEELVFNGGGHNNSSDNSVIGLNLMANSPALRTICEPTPIGERGSGVVWWGTAPNQKPAACHTYDSGVYSTSLNRLLWVAQSSPWGSAGGVAGGNRLFSLDYATGQWIQLASDLGATPTGAGKMVCRDPAGNIYSAAVSQSIWKYASGTWTELSNNGLLNFSGLGALVFDSARNRLLRVSCDANHWLTIDASTGSVTDVSGLLSGTGSVVADLNALILVDSPGCCYDPDNDRFCIPTGSGASFYSINAATWAVTLVTPGTVSGSVPNAIDNGTNAAVQGRFKYVPRLRGIAYVAKGAANAWFLPTASI